jgi:hypothetical protein
VQGHCVEPHFRGLSGCTLTKHAPGMQVVTLLVQPATKESKLSMVECLRESKIGGKGAVQVRAF